jgi:hypothetical protein
MTAFSASALWGSILLIAASSAGMFLTSFSVLLLLSLYSSSPT